MEVIAHRGFWKENGEKNHLKAFHRAVEYGIGTETDIRDFNENLVVSHDMAAEDSLSADAFFSLYADTSKTLALNIKADGLQAELKRMLEKYHINNYFCFDMSIPDTLGYIDKNIAFFTRESEYEPCPVFLTKAIGIWIDGFYSDDWITEEKIAGYLNSSKKVCIVSPELHGRDYQDTWGRYRRMECSCSNNLILCTDYPEEARGYFDE